MELIFGPEEGQEVKELGQKSLGLPTRVGGAPTPLDAPPASWTARRPPDLFLTPKPLIYTQTSRKEPRSGVPPPQALVATENQSRPVPAPFQRGESLSGGHLHHPGALHDEEGVVHPRG